MLGNDVVDLADPETGVEQLNPRFDQRILTAKEQDWIKSCGDPHVGRWTLWAAKEASYKRGRKLFPDLYFSPRQFETQLLSLGQIQVQHPRLSSHVHIKHQGQYVHALALPTQTHRVCNRAFMSRTTVAISQLLIVPKSRPSQQMRDLACQHLARHLQLDKRSLTILTQDKIPYLIGPKQQSLGDLSFSHHGRFLALAFLPFGATTQ